MLRYYFDHNATTPVSPEVLEAMVPVLAEVYGNASSLHHFGQAARKRLDEARRQTASLLGAAPEEIVFTSGGTEADNLALLGFGRDAHAITTTVEHPAVLAAAAQLASATYVPVDSRGLVDPDDIRGALRPDTKIISVIHANNELGTIQPIDEIAEIAREAGVAFHSDGVQAAGKIAVDVNRLGVTLYSIAGHKLYAPKGVGALYVRKGTQLAPILHGGNHERNRRAGTENVPGAVALGRAAQWMMEHGPAESRRLETLRDRLEASVLDRIPGVRVNGAGALRVSNTSNLRFDGIDTEPLLIALDLRGFAVSSGSACSSGASEPSHVLTAIGLTKEQARSSLRISLGRSNDAGQIDALVDALTECVARLRKLAPSKPAPAYA
ncbi:MAG TPA: cysteine desulfurase family protein [Stellaceae bacterium]|jgi:cysteine desulfurase|nr:cysteine desulfurase family protein [Stellaceae bacterium]